MHGVANAHTQTNLGDEKWPQAFSHTLTCLHMHVCTNAPTYAGTWPVNQHLTRWYLPQLFSAFPLHMGIETDTAVKCWYTAGISLHDLDKVTIYFAAFLLKRKNGYRLTQCARCHQLLPTAEILNILILEMLFDTVTHSFREHPVFFVLVTLPHEWLDLHFASFCKPWRLGKANACHLST